LIRRRGAQRVTEKKRETAEREKQDEGEGLRSREKKGTGKMTEMQKTRKDWSQSTGQN